jgi:hypothetical protein
VRRLVPSLASLGEGRWYRDQTTAPAGNSQTRMQIAAAEQRRNGWRECGDKGILAIARPNRRKNSTTRRTSRLSGRKNPRREGHLPTATGNRGPEVGRERSSQQAHSGGGRLRPRTRLAAGEIRPACSCMGAALLLGANAGRLYRYGLQHPTRARKPCPLYSAPRGFVSALSR